MATNILITAFMLFSLNCTSKSDLGKDKSVKNVNSHSLNVNDTLFQYIDEWKKDSLGCLKLRTKEKAETIIRILKKDAITEQMLYQNLGKPNKVQQNNDTHILVYYFDCICNNENLVKGSDKCYAKFYIQSDAFKEMMFICE